MKFKSIAYFFFFILISLFNISDVHAAFNMQNKNATYNSNTGLLTIYHSELNEDEYRAIPNKFKLGNVAVNATTKIEPGVLKLFVLNKNEVNQQPDFSNTGMRKTSLTMNDGALIKSYRPPNSINIILESQSNETKLNVNVIGQMPPVQISEITSNIKLIEGEGKKITILVKGKNLDTGIFELRDLNSSRKYSMITETTTASVVINIPTNYMDTKRIDTFVLYLNNQETTQRISIEVLPYQENTVNTPEKTPPLVETPDNVVGDNKQNQDSNVPTDKEEKTNKTNPDVPIDNETHSPSEEIDKGSVAEKEEKAPVPTAKSKEKSMQTILFVIGSFGLAIAVGIYCYIKYRKHK